MLKLKLNSTDFKREMLTVLLLPIYYQNVFYSLKVIMKQMEENVYITVMILIIRVLLKLMYIFKWVGNPIFPGFKKSDFSTGIYQYIFKSVAFWFCILPIKTKQAQQKESECIFIYK